MIFCLLSLPRQRKWLLFNMLTSLVIVMFVKTDFELVRSLAQFVWSLLVAESLLGLETHFFKGTAAIAVHDEQARPSLHQKRSLRTPLPVCIASLIIQPSHSCCGISFLFIAIPCSLQLSGAVLWCIRPELWNFLSQGPGGTWQVHFFLSRFTCRFYKSCRNSVCLQRTGVVCVCVCGITWLLGHSPPFYCSTQEEKRSM